MHYIVIDLEFNQAFDFPSGDKTVTDPKCPFEIIQIGAVKLDDRFQEVARKGFFVKPQIYNRMHPFVEKITGISMSELQDESTFDIAYKDFVSFIGKGKSTLAVWGANDMKALYRNIMYYDLNNKLLTRKYINVQQLASQHLKQPAHHSVGLKAAVEALDICPDSSFHDALNDAVYTAKIFQMVRTDHMPVQSFNLSQLKQRTMAKITALNSGLLFQFVEKDLHRRLTDREKETVIKIYNAGQRHAYDIHPAEPGPNQTGPGA